MYSSWFHLQQSHCNTSQLNSLFRSRRMKNVQEGKVEIEAHKVDTLKYVERKLEDKGLHRLERHPRDGAGIRKPPPKSGHGGKYTWEGPDDMAEAELSPPPSAIDPNDPNYVEDGEIEEEEEAAELVKGSVEVAKVAQGVARVEVHHTHQKTN